jgi:hypothetical protein
MQMVVFRCPPIARFSHSNLISNPDSLSGRETVVIPGIRSCKSPHLNELDIRKPFAVSISQSSEERIFYSLFYDLTISNLGYISGVFKCIS